MTEIRFYHLRTKTLEQALPEILAKALEQQRRVVIRTRDADMSARLDAHLWSFRPDSFLPHGRSGDPQPAAHPIWLTDADENPNGADILILTGGADSAAKAGFSLCCDMFDGGNDEALAAARVRWKSCTEAGLPVTYWQQTDQGGWEKKA